MKLYFAFDSVVEPVPFKDRQILKKMQNLFDRTILDPRTGVGMDARGLKHKRLRVTTVTKLNNTKLWRQYMKRRKILQEKAKTKRGGRFMKVGDLTKSVATTGFHGLELGEQPCDENVNEVYLFHGTAEENNGSIIREGFRMDKANNGLYGKALYFAESVQKADQYAGRTTE